MFKDILKQVNLEYQKKRDIQEKARQKRIEEVYEKVPAIKRIDEEIFKTGLDMSKYIINNPENYEGDMNKAKEVIEALKMEKAYLLTESNIPLDYMESEYDCETCKDTGYLDNGRRCNCLKQNLVSKAYKMSNLE